MEFLSTQDEQQAKGDHGQRQGLPHGQTIALRLKSQTQRIMRGDKLHIGLAYKFDHKSRACVKG